jgi:outer membrane murein-binding lipoprotein Lpp
MKKAIKTTIALLIVTALAACSGQSKVNTPSPEVAALQAQITQLTHDAEQLEAVSSVKRLQRAYGFYLDAGKWDEAADLFATNATLELGLGGVYVGKDHIRKYLYALADNRKGLQYGEINEHMQLQPVVHVAEDGLTAKARWREFSLTGEYGKFANWGEGPQENEYIKESGVWKIKKLHWYRTFVVPYEGGWGKNADVGTDKDPILKSLPPDQPSTETYGLWPNVYIPAYHYNNPVTGVDRNADRGQGRK